MNSQILYTVLSHTWNMQPFDVHTHGVHGILGPDLPGEGPAALMLRVCSWSGLHVPLPRGWAHCELFLVFLRGFVP